MKISDFEGVSKAEAAAAGLGAPPAAAAAATAPSAPVPRSRSERRSPRRRKAPLAAAPVPAAPPPPPEPPPPVFAPGRERSAPFPLDWPVTYDGVTYATLVLRRPSAREIGAYLEALADGARIPLPVFFTPEGDPVPFQVIDALDSDDDDRIFGRLNDFLPDRLLRAVSVVSGPSSTPASGETTAPTSST